MYCLTDQQIDYIRDDIHRRGIRMEGLQENLLDHICCIIEQELPEDGDFASFYAGAIQAFYKQDLREIETETVLLLTFKNYYLMKNVMLVSGAASVAAFLFGSVFKFMYWPGASVLLVLGMLIACFVFAPLMVLFKAKELVVTRDRLILFLGSLTGILYGMSALFRVMHWPGARILWFGTLIALIFILISVYFFTGIRRPELRLNTMLVTIILIAFTSIQFLLTALRPSPPAPPVTYELREAPPAAVVQR